MTRVLLVSEHSLLRQGISRLLGETDSISAVHDAADSEAALQRIQLTRPDVILLHIDHPVGNRMMGLRSLRDQAPDIPVVLLLDAVDDDVMVIALQAGAAGCLDKSVDTRQLSEALDEAAKGEVALSAPVARRLARILSGSGRDAKRQSYPDPLTGRESQVLQLLAQGLTNREIARSLFVSESTVRAHLRTVTRKLGVNNRVHAVARALQMGIVSTSEPEEGSRPGGRYQRVAG